jgi:hypothetical protein
MNKNMNKRVRVTTSRREIAQFDTYAQAWVFVQGRCSGLDVQVGEYLANGEWQWWLEWGMLDGEWGVEKVVGMPMEKYVAYLDSCPAGDERAPYYWVIEGGSDGYNNFHEELCGPYGDLEIAKQQLVQIKNGTHYTYEYHAGEKLGVEVVYLGICKGTLHQSDMDQEVYSEQVQIAM